MTIRNLDKMFNPTSIALIGASNKERSVGSVVAHNLLNSGFKGPILPCNPRDKAIAGVLAYPSVSALPIVPDLGIVCTPPEHVPMVIDDLARAGTKAAVVITAGFGEGGDAAGHALRQKMLDAAKPHLLRIVGPNCVGILVPGAGVNASFAHVPAKTGKIAFVSQSGAVATVVLDWCAPRNIGFSHVVSLGDMSDVDFADMLDYLALDIETSAILLYIESIGDARKFMSAARAAARIKPVIAIKTGRFAEGAKAAASHTGAMAGSDAVLDAALRRAGVLRVRDLDELFDSVEILAHAKRPRGDRLGILTNGGGLGVIATDELIGSGGRLAELTPVTVEALNKVLPTTWSHANPVDIIGDADGARYTNALIAMDKDPNIDAILALNCPTAIASSVDAAEAIAAALPQTTKPLLTAWAGEGAAREARQLLAAKGLPSFDTPTQAVNGFMRLVRYRKSQEELAQTPPSIPDFPVDTDHVRKLIAVAISEGREWLDEFEAKEVLAAYGIPVVKTYVANTPEEAGRIADQIGGTVVIKIRSRDLTHKSDIGGVRLNLKGGAEVREAAETMLRKIGEAKPEAHLEGFTVQEMVQRTVGYELIVGLATDPVFGPVVLFGQGGVAAEAIGDRALALPPLNMTLAMGLINGTRVVRQLKNKRAGKPADLDAIALALVRLAQLAADVAEVKELDVNPLLANADGVIALDARVRVGTYTGRVHGRLAIKPYPREFESDGQLKDGTAIRLRPLRPEDEPALIEAFKSQSPDDVRLRFFAPIRDIPHTLAARLTQLDYNREMAIVAMRADNGEPLGVARYSADPDNYSAEYAIAVRSNEKGRGIGKVLLERLIDIARQRGLQHLTGEVLAENTGMLGLAKSLGFTRKRVVGEGEVFHTALELAAE